MSDALDRLLAGQTAPDIYRWSSRAGVAAVAERAAAAGWRCFALEGNAITCKEELLAQLSHALAFPAWVGHNWDALLDALRDLSWAPSERGYLLIFDDARHLASTAPDSLAVLLDVLRDAASFWRASDTPFAVLVRRPGRAWRLLPRLT